MGFHRRHVSKSNIIRLYQEKGIEGLHQLYRADSFVNGGKFASKITDLYFDNKYEELERSINDEIKNNRTGEDLDDSGYL